MRIKASATICIGINNSKDLKNHLTNSEIIEPILGSINSS